MTTLEKNRVALKFMKMNENPDAFLMHNRFLAKAPTF